MPTLNARLPDPADELEAPDTPKEIAEDGRGWNTAPRDPAIATELDEHLTRTGPDGDDDAEDIP